MPDQFWIEVVNTVIYLLNQLSISVLNKCISFKVFVDYKLNLNELKVFGCIAYAIDYFMKFEKKDDFLIN